eukprot:3034024-Rhodomonas_salina.1
MRHAEAPGRGDWRKPQGCKSPAAHRLAQRGRQRLHVDGLEQKGAREVPLDFFWRHCVPDTVVSTGAWSIRGNRAKIRITGFIPCLASSRS